MRKVPEKYRNWLMKELPVLEEAGVLSSDHSRAVRDYYSTQTRSGLHWAIMAFAVLGSLLIGSGIILLLAHNWEVFGRPARTLLSFLPVALGAGLSLTALLRKGGPAWREAAGILHSLTVGASIALIGQTYHLSSDVPSFFLSWELLILPLMFLLRSTGAALIYLALSCAWSGLAQETYGQAAAFWFLILPVAVRLTWQLRHDRHAVATSVSLAGFLLTLCIGTGIALERTVPGLWIVTYSALLSGCGLLGLWLYGDREGWNNIAKTFGIIGVAVLAYLYTWPDVWSSIGWEHIRHEWRYRTWGIWFDAGVTLTFLAGWALVTTQAFRRHTLETLVLSLFPVITTLCYLIGSGGHEAACTANAMLFNGFTLALGILYIVLGCRDLKLRQLNGGMALVALLLVTRFFDTDFSYLVRGLVFITLGAIFLTANLFMARRKKAKEIAV